MASVFDVLGRDHVEVKRTLAELEKGPTAATGADEDALALRKKMTKQPVIEELKHEAVEEMYSWPTVREALPDGDKLADTATGQEQEAKHVLIGSTSWTPATWSSSNRSVHSSGGREHIDYEEGQVWPPLREALSPEQANELGDKLEAGKSTAPTRPHPHTPPSPGVLKAAGPAVAAADRARDAVTHRDE